MTEKQASAGRGEGLAGLVAKWREDMQYCLKRSDELANLHEDKRSEIFLTRGRTKEICASELETALEAAAPVGTAPASLGQILGRIHERFNHREPHIGAWDAQRIVVAEVIRAALATPSPQAPQCCCNVSWLGLDQRDCPIHGPAATQEPAGSGALRERLCERITSYLTLGGLFNAELANHDAVRELLIDCRIGLSLSSPIEPPAAGKGPTETLIRMFLWQGHGHEGIYGDDGEMQCGECGVDYKRDSLDICVEKARVATLQTGLAKLARPTSQASSEIREAQTFEQWWQAEGAHMVRTTHCTRYEVMKEAWKAALAPSRQGAGGSTKS